MAKNKGLGKGLRALISENVDLDDNGIVKLNSEDIVANETMIVDLDLSKVKPNPKQPRQHFEKKALEELAASIKEHGILQPLLVQKEKEIYIIISGERRFRAAHIAGLKTVPVIIKDLSPMDVLEISLIENLQREDLNVMEEALAYKVLMNNYNLTQGEVGIKIGKSRAAVANTMRLLNLPESVQNLVVSGKLSSGHARALLGLDDEKQIVQAADTVIQKKLNVRETEKLISEMKKSRRPKQKHPVDPYLADAEEQLKDHFHTDVKIKSKDNKGKIELAFYSADDLNRLLDLLKLSGR